MSGRRTSLRPVARLCGALALVVLALGLLLLAAATPLAAQQTETLRRQAERALGRPITDAEILRRIRESGLTPEQIRDRLEGAGFERTAADPYLAILAGASAAVPEGTDPMPLVQVLTATEVGAGEPRLGRIPAERPPPAPAARPQEAPGGLPIFGRELFRRATSQFQPVTAGPVPPDYRLGPGDEVILVLTGGVEQAYDLTVSREGWIVIPDVGRVLVNGLTLAELEEALFQRLSQVYSGIRRGRDATTFFNVSIGELRTNQVYVLGEVEEPAAYQVSSLATALTALYWAGGPGVNGSFREVVVNRGGRTLSRIDLYDYLLRGDASRDVRLEQGDIVFVPTAERRVAVDGAVLRRGLYELGEGETLADAIRFAGGLQPQADLRRVQISRILPPAERQPGFDRAILDVSLGSVAEGSAVELRDGDRISIFAVLAETRNEVTVSGGVWRPGTYAVEPGTRLWDVIGRAGGLLPDAYEGRAQIQRLEEEEFTRRMIQVGLAIGSDGTPLENPELRGMDQVFIFAKRELREGRVVSIGGWVRRPGVYPYADGMTLRDLVLRAGGLRTGAFLGHAEVARLLISQERTDTLTRRFRVPLDSSYVFSTAGEERASGAGDDGPPGAPGRPAAAPDPRNEFALRNLDAVFLRRAPGFAPQRSVVVTGEVMLPGPYSLETRRERLTDLVRRAGGLTTDAYPEGLQLWRAVGGPGTAAGAGTDTLSAAAIASGQAGVSRVGRARVGVDFVEARRHPDGPQNVLIEPNDSLFVPRYVATVTVQGAVEAPAQILYRKGAGLGYYIERAGGYSKGAFRSRTRVRYASGDVQIKGGNFLFLGGQVADPDPGSVITVPVKPPREGGGINTSQLVAVLTSLATAAATIAIAAR
ncbi:MAG: SLBB domain-containing protein [Gemmatimonadota bacterium]